VPAELYAIPQIERSRHQIRQALRYAWAVPDMRANLALATVFGVFGLNFAVILPVLARKTFDGTATTYSWMTVAMGLGAVVAVLLVARAVQVKRWAPAMMGAAFGVSSLLTAAAPNLAIMLGLLCLVGATNAGFSTLNGTVVQMRCEPKFRGRIVSFRITLVNGTRPLGAVLAGLALTAFGARAGLLMTGVATMLGIALFAVLITRPRPLTEPQLGDMAAPSYAERDDLSPLSRSAAVTQPSPMVPAPVCWLRAERTPKCKPNAAIRDKPDEFWS
jgi:MFS family permease